MMGAMPDGLVERKGTSMAFKVELQSNKFLVSIEESQVKAATLDEVKKALEHYFARPWHTEKAPGCPLCQL